MAHYERNTGSIRTMRRTLMGGAIVSTLLIASLTPANAGCLNPQVRINAQIVDYSNTQSSQLGVNWRGATGSQNSGGQLRWAPMDDLRIRTQFGYNNARPSPRAERSGYISPTADEFLRRRPNINVPTQTQTRYRNQFGGVRIGSNQTVQWGQSLNGFQPNVNLANQIERVEVRRQPIPRLGKIPAINFNRDRSASNRAEVIIQVTPRIVRNNER